MLPGQKLVRRVMRSLPLEELRAALHAGYHDAFGTCPGNDRIRDAWAQCCLEHGMTADGRGIRAVWNNNLGNQDAGRELGDVFLTVAEREVIGGQDVLRQHLRRSFSTPGEGARAYWTRLQKNWPNGFSAAGEGPVAFAAGLKRDRYYTERQALYAAALVPLVRLYDRLYDPLELDVFCGWVDAARSC